MATGSIRQNSGDLPQEIIQQEILPRVSSVKSLMRFKCLSKSYYKFISTEKFAKTHFQKSVTNLSQIYSILISSSFKDHFVVDYCPLEVMFSRKRLDEPDLIHFELDYPKNRDNTVKLVGCSNGLCCIYVCQKDFVLFNPFTRKSFTLPPPYEKPYKNVCNCIGFGYDEANDDYKVLVKSVSSTCFRMYSLKTNSWKTVDDFMLPGRIMQDFPNTRTYESQATGVLVNGKLHWALRPDDWSLKIVSFDLGSEAVGVVEPPGCTNADRDVVDQTMLGVIDGCLCVFRGFRSRKGTQVWTMKEYGVRESWDEVLMIPSLWALSDEYTYSPPYPLYISDEENVLANQNIFDYIYNPKTKSRRSLIIKNSCMTFAHGFCVESLASPFPPASYGTEPPAE